MKTSASNLVRLLLTSLLLAGCRRAAAPPDGSGTIECTQVQVAPQVGGRLLRLPPQEGAVLKKGELVAELDPTDYRLKRDEARAGLAQAQAQLDLMLAGSRDEDVQRARDQVREAAATEHAADADLTRVTAVFARQSATRKQLDDAQAAADRAVALRAQAEQGLAKLLRGNRQEEIRAAAASVELARAKLAQMEKAIKDCTVFAPMDGVVTTRSHEEGEVIGAGAPVITLSRLDEVWLAVYVPEPRLAGVTLGQPARVRVDGVDRFFAGKVTFISPEAEFTPRNVQTPEERAKLVYRVKITLPNPQGVFKPGMPADGYVGGPR